MDRGGGFAPSSFENMMILGKEMNKTDAYKENEGQYWRDSRSKKMTSTMNKEDKH